LQFSDLGLDNTLMSTVQHLGFKEPTQIILTPTRELAKQVFSQLRLFTANTQFKAVLILGGENFNDQVKVLEKEPHFIVATPGRLADHLTQGHFYLNGLELLILDEADRMLDLGFSKELSQINKAANHRKRQTLLFSATLDHAQVNEFATELLKKPKRIAINAGHSEHLDITKRFYLADNLTQKEALLQHFLTSETTQQVIIFTATRSDTERLAKMLSEEKLNAVALSGELNQGQRNQIMESFAKGHHKILVTTDLASRGLDLVNVSHVINFDMPKHTEEFVHRIGRTGRAGTKGIKVSFKGLKPKKPRVEKAKPVVNKSKKVADNRPRKVIKKTFLDIQDAGAMKIIKRKKALTPAEIEDSTKKEQD